MSEKRSLTGIVLAGGLSRRMGRDKASLPWGGEDLLHAVLRALAPVCGELIVVSNRPRAIAVADVAVVGDRYEGCGPLGGIHAGLSAAGGEYSFVAACDMPYLKSEAVAFMAAAAAGYDAAVPFIDGYYHPLHAVYSRRCLPIIEEMLAAGRRRIIDFYPAVNLRQINAVELAGFDPALAMLSNLNSPEDLPGGDSKN
jgi:molybdopterin-guanine dinucleotide biosynthesis protein A